MQGVYFGTDELYFIEAMNDFKLAFTDISLGSVFNIMSGLGNIAQAFWQWLTWDYSFFYGSWEMFRYLLMTISFGFVVSFGIELASVLRWI